MTLGFHYYFVSVQLSFGYNLKPTIYLELIIDSRVLNLICVQFELN